MGRRGEAGSDQQIALIQTSHRDLHLLMQHCLAAGRSATPLGVGHPGVQRTARQAKRTMEPTPETLMAAIGGYRARAAARTIEP